MARTGGENRRAQFVTSMWLNRVSRRGLRPEAPILGQRGRADLCHVISIRLEGPYADVDKSLNETLRLAVNSDRRRRHSQYLCLASKLDRGDRYERRRRLGGRRAHGEYPRVEDLEDLFTAAETLTSLKRVAGNELLIVTNGERRRPCRGRPRPAGGSLAKLSDDLIAELDAILPATWSRANPIDIIGDATATVTPPPWTPLSMGRMPMLF